MRPLAPRLARVPLALVVVLLLATGCRTYGGYGTEEATYAQMERAARLYADALDRAEGDLQALTNAAASTPALQEVVAAYEEAVATHRARLESHQGIVAEYGPGDTYRGLHRAYGTMVTEQRMSRYRYVELHEQVARVMQGEEARLASAPPRSEYQIAPSWYDRLQNAKNRLTMQEALRGGRLQG
jgi:hypothetical protein